MRNLGTLTRLWRREFWVNLCENSRFFVNFWLNSLKNSRQIVIASGFKKPRSNPQSKIRIHAVIARRGTRRSNPLRAQGAFLDINSHFLSTNSRPKNALRALMDCFEFATQILAMTGRGVNFHNFCAQISKKFTQIFTNQIHNFITQIRTILKCKFTTKITQIQPQKIHNFNPKFPKFPKIHTKKAP